MNQNQTSLMLLTVVASFAWILLGFVVGRLTQHGSPSSGIDAQAIIDEPLPSNDEELATLLFPPPTTGESMGESEQQKYCSSPTGLGTLTPQSVTQPSSKQSPCPPSPDTPMPSTISGSLNPCDSPSLISESSRNLEPPLNDEEIKAFRTALRKRQARPLPPEDLQKLIQASLQTDWSTSPQDTPNS